MIFLSQLENRARISATLCLLNTIERFHHISGCSMGAIGGPILGCVVVTRIVRNTFNFGDWGWRKAFWIRYLGQVRETSFVLHE